MKASNQATRAARTAPPNKPAVTVRNPYVKSNSIHSSFQTISAETEKYRNATTQAQADRQALLQRLQNGKKQTNDLADAIRVAQDALGGVQHEVRMLERQEAILRTKLTKERQISQDLSAEIQAWQASEKQERIDYCAQLSALNSELGVLLKETEAQRLIHAIHPETAAAALLDDEAVMAQTHQDDQEEEEDAAKVRESLRAALQVLQQTAEEFENIYAQKEDYENQITEARRRVLESQSTENEDSAENKIIWTEDRLLELESAWEQDWGSDDMPQASFYSQGDESRDDNTTASTDM